MSVFANSDLLEEIVETTEEQEAEICSNGEAVDDCTGLPINDFVEEPEHKHHIVQIQQASGASTSSTSGASSSGGTRQHKSSAGSAGSSSQQNVATTLNGSNSGAGGTQTSSRSRSHMEQEKRMRREIANSNERRRMQGINAGFQSLRTLLPHHEGEKLSKAAILQQTAEYIYQLEQQKTRLLSQNLQLKRLVDQHEGGDVPTKKRKNDNQGVVVGLPVHVSEGGDEGLGSMSPGPLSVITVSADGHASVAAATNEVAELKRQLERERVARAHLEKQMRALQGQLFPERFREEQIIAYQPHEVIEHTNNVLPPELEDGMRGLQVVSVVSVPTVGSAQTVETSNADSNAPPLSPRPGCEIIVPGGAASDICDTKEVSVGELLQIDSRPSSPKIVTFADGTGVVFASSLDEQTGSSAGSFSPGTVTYATASLPVVNATASDFKAVQAAGQFITASPTGPFSPDQDAAASVSGSQQRLPSVLEAAIKAEPEVEVERLPSPSNSMDEAAPQARIYLANTSRQNLETIVEAIRHLEGDHLFSDEPAQDVPLALTNKPSSSGPCNVSVTGNASTSPPRLLHSEVNNFLQFHTTPQQQQQQQQQISSPASAGLSSQTTATAVQSQTQQRPGVIVVKHS